MRKQLILTAAFIIGLTACTSKEVQIAEINLKNAELKAAENKDIREKQLIQELNKPPKLLELEGCSVGCTATLYNPFYKPVFPTNEHDADINRQNRIAETIQRTVPTIVGGAIVNKALGTVEAVAATSIKNAGHNTTITKSSSVVEDNDSSVVNSADGNTNLSATGDILQGGSEKREGSASYVAGQDIKQNSENSVSTVTDANNNKSVSKTKTEIKEEVKNDTQENNP